MKKTMVDQIRADLGLVDENLREWNLKYFNGHLNRYLSDLQIVKAYSDMNGKVLEIGSVPYHFTAMLGFSGYNVTGLDVKPDRANGFLEKYNLRIVKCDVDNDALPFEDESFDLIIFNEVFEHLRINPVRTLREINRILKPDGRMILSTPNLHAAGNVYMFLRGRSIDSSPYEQFLKLETVGHMGHVRVYSAREMTEFLTNTNFAVEKIIYRYNRKSRKTLFKLVYRLFTKLRPQLVIISKKKSN